MYVVKTKREFARVEKFSTIYIYIAHDSNFIVLCLNKVPVLRARRISWFFREMSNRNSSA